MNDNGITFIIGRPWRAAQWLLGAAAVAAVVGILAGVYVVRKGGRLVLGMIK